MVFGYDEGKAVGMVFGDEGKAVGMVFDDEGKAVGWWSLVMKVKLWGGLW